MECTQLKKVTPCTLSFDSFLCSQTLLFTLILLDCRFRETDYVARNQEWIHAVPLHRADNEALHDREVLH